MRRSNKWDARTSSGVLALVAPVFALLMQSPVFGVDYTTVYQTDFSADPGWVTDQPANYYWDSGAQTYHATTVNAQPGPSPTRYTYTPINYGGGSFRLELDMQPTDIQWSAGVGFGLYDASLTTWPPATPDRHWVQVFIGRSDAGEALQLTVRGSSGVLQYPQLWNVLSDGTWYHSSLSTTRPRMR